MFERVVYVSRAAPGVSARDCYDIIRTAHNRNSRFGLTGALLSLDGHFVQVLEGDRHAVRERFQRIAADPRHTAVDLRQSLSCDTRLFPQDWMALRSDAEIDPEVLSRFGYLPGLPAAHFDGERIAAFVQACCAQQARPT